MDLCDLPEAIACFDGVGVLPGGFASRGWCVGFEFEEAAFGKGEVEGFWDVFCCLIVENGGSFLPDVIAAWALEEVFEECGWGFVSEEVAEVEDLIIIKFFEAIFLIGLKKDFCGET